MKILLPFLFCSLAALSGALLAQSETKLVAEFAKAIRSDPRQPRTVAARLAALDKIDGLDSGKVAEALATAYSDVENELIGHETARLAALAEKRELIAGQENAKSRNLPQEKMQRFNELTAELDRLRQLIDEMRGLQDALAERVGALRSESARKHLLKKVLGGKRTGLTLQLAAAEAVAHGGADSVPDVAKALDRSKKVAEKVALIDALAQIGEAAGEAADLLLECLEDGDEVVRERAALALSHLKDVRAIPAMIDLLEKEAGMVKKRIAGALEVLTRQEHGDSVGAWRAWYEAEGKALAAGDLGGGRPSKAKAFDKDNYYFGLPQDGKGILYVIDASDSMKEPVELKLKTTSAAGSNKTTRLEACKAELIKALGQLTADTKFNVVWYNDLPHIWRDSMSLAKKDAVREAQAWVKKLNHSSSTNIHDALQLGFTQVGRGVHDKYYGVELDTIFLLTDGSPTKLDGTFDSTEKILTAVQAWNPLKRITIHTIGIGNGVNVPFLQDLAAQNGGEFKQY